VKYKSGGVIIAAAVHWIELKNLGNVSDSKIEEIVQNFTDKGYSAYSEQYTEYVNFKGSDVEKEEKKQKLVSQMVQKSAPTKYKKKK